MHCTATNGDTRTSTLAPGAMAASVRAVNRTASASSVRPGSGRLSSRSHSANRRHGGARLRRIDAAAGGHTLDSQSACRPPPTALQNGRRGVTGGRRGRRSLHLSAVSRRPHRQDPADPAVAAGGPGGRTGLEGDLQRRGDRPCLRYRHGRRARHAHGQTHAGRESSLHQVHPRQRRRRDPGHHGVRQQVHLVQLSEIPFTTTYFEPRCDRRFGGDHGVQHLVRNGHFDRRAGRSRSS